jgi:hypothetical protein
VAEKSSNASEIEVEFTGGGEVRVKGRCSAAAPAFTVREGDHGGSGGDNESDTDRSGNDDGGSGG